MPRMVILAAGKGERLRPLTDERPKCLVDVAGKSLLDWQLDAALRAGIRDVAIVTGHRAERLPERGVRRYHNPAYAETNMVETLRCAKPELCDDAIVSYGDILYEDVVLRSLLASAHPIAVVVDLGWLSYWQARFEDPLRDAETLRLSGGGRILEIGRRPAELSQIEGQYIGLMRFRAEGLTHLDAVYAEMARRGPVAQMYMTDLLQAVIDAGHPVQAVPVRRRWLEIDSIADYELANRSVQAGPEGPRILI